MADNWIRDCKNCDHNCVCGNTSTENNICEYWDGWISADIEIPQEHSIEIEDETIWVSDMVNVIVNEEKTNDTYVFMTNTIKGEFSFPYTGYTVSYWRPLPKIGSTKNQ